VLEVLQVTRDQVIHANHFVSLMDEAVTKVRAQEAGGAGNEDAWHF
jgi:hypothetical protein